MVSKFFFPNRSRIVVKRLNQKSPNRSWDLHAAAYENTIVWLASNVIEDCQVKHYKNISSIKEEHIVETIESKLQDKRYWDAFQIPNNMTVTRDEYIKKTKVPLDKSALSVSIQRTITGLHELCEKPIPSGMGWIAHK